MMYCTKCGSNLKGSIDRCPVCKYPVSKMKQDLTGPGKRERRSTPPKFAPPYPTEGVKKDMKWREQEREEAEVVKFTDEGRVSETGEDEQEDDLKQEAQRENLRETSNGAFGLFGDLTDQVLVCS